MTSNSYLGRTYRTVLFLFLIIVVSLASAAGQARKKSRSNTGGESPDDYTKPELLNSDANPTLRYPAASFSGWSVKSSSYGWLDVTRQRIRFAVVQPADKINEGFDMATTEVTELKIENGYLNFHRGADKKKYMIFYLSQERWGTIHSGMAAIGSANVGALGTASMFQAIRNFDNVLAMVKPPAPPPAPVIAQPVAPTPEPKPAAPPSPPTIVVLAPSGAAANQTLETQEASAVIRGVAMDNTGIPVVSINGLPSNMRPQNPQAAEFWSDALALKPGDNPVQISAANSAHVEASVAFTIHYTPKAAPVNPKALDKTAIISLLVGNVPPPRIVAIVKERGIKFTPTTDDLNEIHAAGGNDELLQALQQAAPPK